MTVSIGLRRSCVLVSFFALMLAIDSCGGGATTGGGGGTPPPPAPTELLYAATNLGIRAFTIDTSSGLLVPGQTLTTGETGFGSPVASASGKFVYSEDRNSDGINVFSVASDGSLSLLSGSPFKFTRTPLDFTGIAVDPKGRSVYAINGIEGVITEFQVNSASGGLTEQPTQVETGSSTWPQQGVVDPSGKFLYVSSSDTNVYSPQADDYSGVVALSISSTGDLTVTKGSPFLMRPNAQPSMIATDPSGSFVYVNLVNANAVAGFTRDVISGSLTAMAGSPFSTENTENPQTEAIAIHPSGRFLYAFNANGNTISAFTIDSTTGVLTPVKGSPFAAPAGIPFMAIDPSGTYLYAAAYGPSGGNSDGMLIFKIDPNTGGLAQVSGSPATLPEPIDSFITVKLQ